ncbi:protease inhibitor I42 family protein [Mycobacterium sp.]|uniref:protease inhibitor I42 family protein n=1 Tax=Mycobacterium sp. TaxID=1785 RepID=UPI002B59AA43|nr:protease inhibitor I42 family protein [Mycobacterium sp.]HME48303.1 protease inhibitor I42 family protein [Mycobacterium sp.]
MKTRLLVIVAIFVSVAVAGCTSSAQPAKTIGVSMDDVLNQKIITRDITLAVGDTLEVSLGANHTTPYKWTAETQIGDSSIVQQTSHEFVAPNPPPGMVGTPGTEVWTFRALKAGTTTIATEYTMSADPTPACTFTANVKVQ